MPPGLRVFTREVQQAAIPQPTHVPPPTISFPPNGATVPLPTAAKDDQIQLKADGGSGPLTWLVNGRLIGSFDRFQPVMVAPPGEGFARIVVVDAQGRSDASEVRFKHLH